jgi:hypothetical protein
VPFRLVSEKNAFDLIVWNSVNLLKNRKSVEGQLDRTVIIIYLIVIRATIYASCMSVDGWNKVRQGVIVDGLSIIYLAIQLSHKSLLSSAFSRGIKRGIRCGICCGISCIVTKSHLSFLFRHFSQVFTSKSSHMSTRLRFTYSC